jgi:hypothetical protein
VAGWLLLAGPLSPAPSGARADSPIPADKPTDTPSATDTAIPTLCFFCNSPPPVETPTPTATPTPTPAPSPTPTAAATAVPTSYSDSIDPQQTQASIPPTNASLGEVPRHTGGGSLFSEWIIFAIVVCAVVAGASFFLFFKIR